MNSQAASVDDCGGTGIALSCLSTISRSVSVMQLYKSAQAAVSVRGQPLEKITVSQLLETWELLTDLGMILLN